MTASDDPETAYENRNEAIQHTINVLADYDRATIDEFGMKSEIADQYGLEAHRIHYVLNRYENVVQWRRRANLDPTDPDAVKAAYDDDTLREMAAVTDGAGKITVEVELSLDEVFRAIKLLPGDLGLKVYRQVLSDDFDPETLRHVLEE